MSVAGIFQPREVRIAQLSSGTPDIQTPLDQDIWVKINEISPPFFFFFLT